MSARLILILAVLFSGCGGSTYTIEDSYDDQEFVYLYCSYGAESRDQLRSCTDHVTVGEIGERDTNAARFARHEIKSCLHDAGPLCKPHPGGRDRRDECNGFDAAAGNC